jgi:hypothetical protein
MLDQLPKPFFGLSQRVRHLLLLRDVARDAQHRFDSAVGLRQGNRMCFQPAWRALERDDAVLELACFPGQATLVQFEIGRAVVGMEQVEERLPAHIVKRVGFDHLQAGTVHVEQAGRLRK